LGDMLELGPYEQMGHELVGKRAAEVVEELITIGNLGKIIAASATVSGLAQTAVHELVDSQAAIEYLKTHLGAEDIVLVKGSRGMRMEQITAALEQRQ
jgi:UDP-N-acetylmuramoyl-tripeptide--D-alanyl-D-alanine ligase